jgi:hypothetical protein
LRSPFKKSKIIPNTILDKTKGGFENIQNPLDLANKTVELFTMTLPPGLKRKLFSSMAT